MFYADYNSTTPLLPGVKEAMEPYWTEAYGNPSSKHYELGKQAARALERAREEVARFFHASPSEMVFVSSGTESCLLAILGAALTRPEKKHIVVSATEHQAVLEVVRLLERPPFAFDISVVPVLPSGELHPSTIVKALRPDTSIVSCMLANNETGAIFPVEELGHLLTGRDIFFHCDAVQAAGKIPVDFNALGVNALSISGHKMGGPKGIGALILKAGSPWISPTRGGGQEDGRRGGTPSVALAVGLGAVTRISRETVFETQAAKIESVRNLFEEKLEKRIPALQVQCSTSRLGNTSCVTFPTLSARVLLEALAIRGVMASTGAACTSQSLEPSHVLLALGLSPTECLSTVRFSFGPSALQFDIELLVDVVTEEVEKCRLQHQKQLQTLMR